MAIGCPPAFTRAIWAFRIALVWIFNLEGTLDLLNALYQGLRLGATEFEVGSFWYVPTFIVPALFVTHFMMFAMLVRGPREARARR